MNSSTSLLACREIHEFLQAESLAVTGSATRAGEKQSSRSCLAILVRIEVQRREPSPVCDIQKAEMAAFHSERASSHRNSPGGSHSTVRRMKTRNTPAGNQSRSTFHNQHIYRRQAYRRAYPHRYHLMHIRSDKIGSWASSVQRSDQSVQGLIRNRVQGHSAGTTRHPQMGCGWRNLEGAASGYLQR
jgi:hypothetical protein